MWMSVLTAFAREVAVDVEVLVWVSPPCSTEVVVGGGAEERACPVESGKEGRASVCVADSGGSWGEGGGSCDS